MSELTRKYFLNPSGKQDWAVTGDKGSISFWVSKDLLYLGGIEYHARQGQRKVPYSDCEFNVGNCWHDGSSSWAMQHWIPNILPQGNEAIWNELIKLYESWDGTVWEPGQ
jgi:hypothetical protein